MSQYEPTDDELVERLQAEFLQPVPGDVADLHLGRLREVTARQATGRRNRYRASLAVAAAAVAALGLQLSTSVFDSPIEVLEPVAVSSSEAELPAQQDAQTQPTDDGESRRLIGRPATQVESGPSSDDDRTVSVLDMASMAEEPGSDGSESGGDSGPMVAADATSEDDDVSDSVSDESSVQADSSSDVADSLGEPDDEQATGNDNNETTTGGPTDDGASAPSTTVVPSNAPTTSTTSVVDEDECETARPGNGNINDIWEMYGMPTGAGHTRAQSAESCEDKTSKSKANRVTTQTEPTTNNINKQG